MSKQSFLDLVKKAMTPRAKEASETDAAHHDGDCSEMSTHSDSSEDASENTTDASHESRS